METQILILLLFALRTVSGQLSIPPAPTLPSLDLSSFPEYMQRLLANRPHTNNLKAKPLYVPHAVRQPYTYGMNLRGDKGEIWNDRTGKHLYINDFAPSKSIHPNLLHNKEDEPNNLNKQNKFTIPEPNNDQKENLPSVTTVKPNNLDTTPQKPDKISTNAEVPKYKNINDSYRPSNSNLKSAYLYYVTPEPLSEEIPAIVEAQQDENVNRSISSGKPHVLYYMTPQPLSEEISANLVVQEDKNVYHKDDLIQTFPSTSTGKPDVLYHNMSPQPLSNKIPAILEVPKDKNVNQNDDAHQTFPSISTGKPDALQHSISPQLLSEKVPTIADKYENSAANTTEIPKESIENINSRGKIEQSFDYITAKLDSNKEIKIYPSPKSYGMKLAGDHGYVWNDLTNPGVHYNVGELDTSETTNHNNKEVMNPSEIPAEITTFHEKDQESNINKEISTRKPTPESYFNHTTEANHMNEQDKPSKNISPEFDDSLKEYIEKLVKEEVARQLRRNIAKEDAIKNKVCENNSDGQESNKTPATNTESSNGHNNYGSIIGNGKVTNVFVFYPNDQNRKSMVNDATILSKPVYEILDDMLNNDKTKNLHNHDVSIASKSAIPTESPVMIMTTEPSKQDTNPGKAIDMRISRFKDDDITTPGTAVASEVNVTTDESAGIDTGNQTAQTTIAAQDNATQANTSDSESTTVNPMTGSSIADITTNASIESSSTDPIPNSSVKEIENNNATTQTTALSDEAAELTTNATGSNITNDSVNNSTDTLNETVGQTRNGTEATPAISNEDAEQTSILTNAEDNPNVTSYENITSEGTVTAEPFDITSEVTVTETDVIDSTDNISTSSDIPLPSSSS